MRWIRRAALLCVLLVVLTPTPAPSSWVGASPVVQVFTEPGANLTPILSLIRSSKSTVRLEIYLLTNRTLIGELAKARKRGVDVRVLLEKHPFGDSRGAQLGYTALHDAGVPTRWANEGAFTYTHEKALEVDGRVAGIFTLNLTSSGIYDNREFGIIDRNAADAQALATIFAADWSRRRPHVSDPRLVVSPYNSRSDLERIVDGAHKTLDIYAEEVADPTIESHLAAARRRGVRVRLITSATSAGVDALRGSGIAVSIMPHPYVHAKAIVADGHHLFVGSENLSTTSLDRNREMGIQLDDSGLASTVEAVFTHDWSGAGSAPPPPSSSSGAFQVSVSAVPSSVSRGTLLTITARTSAGASCGVRVTYPDGYVSRAQSLAAQKIADAGGMISWSWHVGSTAAGTARAAVSCVLGGHTATGSASFEIKS